jgi:glycogen debranching enzyme
VTPRGGKPIEIQALFYNALGIASKFNSIFGHKKLSVKYDEMRGSVRSAINERYFPEGRRYPLDVIDGDPHIDAVRPNALALVSLSNVGDLLPLERKTAIVETVAKELLTPYGLRTLASSDRRYVGRYDTFAPMKVKDLAYHQGTVWPYLLSPYVFAKRSVTGDSEEFAAGVKKDIAALLHFVNQNETLCEVFSGDVPHAPGGAVSQAWSVGAVMEIFDLLNENASRLRRLENR